MTGAVLSSNWIMDCGLARVRSFFLFFSAKFQCRALAVTDFSARFNQTQLSQPLPSPRSTCAPFSRLSDKINPFPSYAAIFRARNRQSRICPPGAIRFCT